MNHQTDAERLLQIAEELIKHSRKDDLLIKEAIGFAAIGIGHALIIIAQRIASLDPERRDY